MLSSGSFPVLGFTDSVPISDRRCAETLISRDAGIDTRSRRFDILRLRVFASRGRPSLALRSLFAESFEPLRSSFFLTGVHGRCCHFRFCFYRSSQNRVTLQAGSLLVWSERTRCTVVVIMVSLSMPPLVVPSRTFSIILHRLSVFSNMDSLSMSFLLFSADVFLKGRRDENRAM